MPKGVYEREPGVLTKKEDRNAASRAWRAKKLLEDPVNFRANKAAKELARYHSALKSDPSYKERRSQYLKNRNKIPEVHAAKIASDRKLKRRKMLGIEHSKFMEVLCEQSFKCGICQKPVAEGATERSQRACADHCHNTGKFRGVLCSRCNSGIGFFYDDPDLIIRALRWVDGGVK